MYGDQAGVRGVHGVVNVSDGWRVQWRVESVVKVWKVGR